MEFPNSRGDMGIEDSFPTLAVYLAVSNLQALQGFIHSENSDVRSLYLEHAQWPQDFHPVGGIGRALYRSSHRHRSRRSVHTGIYRTLAEPEDPRSLRSRRRPWHI